MSIAIDFPFDFEVDRINDDFDFDRFNDDFTTTTPTTRRQVGGFFGFLAGFQVFRV